MWYGVKETPGFFRMLDNKKITVSVTNLTLVVQLVASHVTNPTDIAKNTVII
jgi:hypothetical protein